MEAAARSSSWTMKRVCLQAPTTLAKRTRSTRSLNGHADRFTGRLRMMRGTRTSACSATSSAFLLPSSARVPSGKQARERFGPLKKASTQTLHRRTHQPLERRKKQDELLLQEDAVSFVLQGQIRCLPFHFTWAAPLFATTAGMLSRIYSDFSRTDVPSSQYRGAWLEKALERGAYDPCFRMGRLMMG